MAPRCRTLHSLFTALPLCLSATNGRHRGREACRIVTFETQLTSSKGDITVIRKLLVLLCTLTMALSLAGMAQAGAAKKAPPTLETEAVFNDPAPGDQASQARVINRLIELVYGAAKNSKIRITMFGLQSGDEPDDKKCSEEEPDPDEPQGPDGDIDCIADRLVHALIYVHKEKGVTVQYLTDGSSHDGGDKDDPAFIKLSRQLADGTAESWARFCPDGGCIGKDSMHNKFFLFTKTLGKSWVVSNTTSNVTKTQEEMWNSGYTVVGDHPLYDRYLRYFNDLKVQMPNPNYYDDHPPNRQAMNTSYQFPRSEDKPDPIVEELDKAGCRGSSVRIGAWSLNREGLATKLHHMAFEGCEVSVLVNNMWRETCRLLVPRFPTGRTVDIRLFRGDDTKGIHQKNILLEGKVPGGTQVFTGSQNLDNPSLHLRDENFLRTQGNPEIYNQFEDNFDLMKERATVRIEDRMDCDRFEPNPNSE